MSAVGGMTSKLMTPVKLTGAGAMRGRRAGRGKTTTRAKGGEKPWGDSTQCVQNGAYRRTDDDREVER